MSVDNREAPLKHGHRKALDWLSSGPKKLLIDGKWVASSSGRTFQAIDPSTEQKLTDVAEAGEADVNAAVDAAQRAFEAQSWQGISPHLRTRFLLKIADLIDQNAEELSFLETLDNGTPLSNSSRWIASGADCFRYYAGWPSKIYGTTNPTDRDRFIYMLREPVGVCALINPWNAPFTMAVNKIAPALACGNTVVIKPAELTSLTTLRLGELILEAGVPAGVVNVVPGSGRVVGSTMVAHPSVAKIAFTGSTSIGKQLLKSAADSLKKVTLELGGKSPNIIFPDAEMDRAVEAAVNAFTRNSGQICSAGTRLFAHESVYDEVAERVSRMASSYKVGSPLEDDTKLGPLISNKQMESVLSYVDTGKEEGATLATGGTRVKNIGFFVEPTVFTNVNNGMKIAQEEIFGPVLSIIPFKDEADAVFKGNDTEYGLAAAVWTRDASRAQRVARSLKSGRVWINTYAEVDPSMSMGGYKQSGLGRELGAESIEAFTQTKSVLMRL